MKKQPMQPMVRDARGVVRFQDNAIVRWLLDEASAGRKVDLNDIGRRALWTDGLFTQADQEQFAQLIGYSLHGFHELSYVSDETAVAASQAAHDQLGEKVYGCRDIGCPIHSGVSTDETSPGASEELGR